MLQHQLPLQPVLRHQPLGARPPAPGSLDSDRPGWLSERPPPERDGGRVVPPGPLHVPEDRGRDVRGDLGQGLQEGSGLCDGGCRPHLPGPVLAPPRPPPQSSDIKETQTAKSLNLPRLGGKPQVQLQHALQHQERREHDQSGQQVQRGLQAGLAQSEHQHLQNSKERAETEQREGQGGEGAGEDGHDQVPETEG